MLKVDPYQVDNLYHSSLSAPSGLSETTHERLELKYSTALPEPPSSSNLSASSFNNPYDQASGSHSTIASLVTRLDSLLMVLKTCKGRQCTHPWESLFPLGEVKDLADALNPQFDEFFKYEVSRVTFDRCERGYIAESEGHVWDGKQVYGMVDEMAFG